MKHEYWQCPKCNHDEYELDQFAATSGKIISKLFDVQSKKFSTVSCKQCKFTEVYKTTTSKIGNIFDFLFGG